MLSRQIWVYGILLACALGGFVAIRSSAMKAAQASRGESDEEVEKHKVSPEMLRGAESQERTEAADFRGMASDGRAYTLSDEWKRGPVVLIFIKDGCPCSVSAESYFNNLHAAYRGHVTFFGVIDRERDEAEAWAARYAVPFPLLLDPHGELVRKYHVTNSAYLALIDTSGKIDSFWPGYSSAMLEAVNARIATLSGLPEAEQDTSQAPDELYSGCPFLVESPKAVAPVIGEVVPAS